MASSCFTIGVSTTNSNRIRISNSTNRNLPERSILVARYNFGCGSSREHAVWAIDDYGFRAVIAESFADIFYNNCFKNGVLPIALAAEQVDQIFQLATAQPGFALSIDLASQTVSGDGFTATFEIDDFRKKRMLQGLDDIAMTLLKEDAIAKFEESRGYAPAGSSSQA